MVQNLVCHYRGYKLFRDLAIMETARSTCQFKFTTPYSSSHVRADHQALQSVDNNISHQTARLGFTLITHTKTPHITLQLSEALDIATQHIHRIPTHGITSHQNQVIASSLFTSNHILAPSANTPHIVLQPRKQHKISPQRILPISQCHITRKPNNIVSNHTTSNHILTSHTNAASNRFVADVLRIFRSRLICIIGFFNSRKFEGKNMVTFEVLLIVHSKHKDIMQVKCEIIIKTSQDASDG